MAAQQVVDNVAILLRILGPVYNGTIGCGVLLKIDQQLFQVAVGIQFQLTSLLAQVLPLGQFPAHLVAFGTDHPKGLVVPCHLFLVLEELLGGFRMLGTHSCEANISTI